MLPTRRLPFLPFLLLTGVFAFSQGQKTTVVGAITDPSGGVIPGAEVSLTRVSTNEVFTTISSATGEFVITTLTPDTYQLRVSASGFKTEVRSGLKLEVARTYRLDTQMSVGNVTEEVQVQAVAPLIRTESPELGQAIDNKLVANLPLATRDVFAALGALTPGIIPTYGNSQGSRLNYDVKGGRNDNIATMDGGEVSALNQVMEFTISPDAVQEFEVKTGLYGTEYGGRSGAQFILVTKSGTNDLHGTFYEYLRNDNMNARNFFDGVKPEKKENQFGAVAGGPIIIPGLIHGKDKAWWFVALDWLRIRQFVSRTGVVPTDAEKAGNFAQTITDPLTGQPFPNNSIPSTRFNPVALKLMPFWPSANTGPGRGFNFTSTSNAPVDQSQVIAKIDYNSSPVNRWSGRFLWAATPVYTTGTIDAFRRPGDKLSNWSQVFTNTRTIKGKIINEFGFHTYRRPYFPGSAGFGDRAGFGPTLGIPGWPARSVDVDGVPTTSLTGFVGLGDGGTVGTVPIGNYQVKDNVTFNHGSHLFKLGYEYYHQYMGFGLTNRSSFSFTNDRFARYSFANFLLGFPTSTTLGSELRFQVRQSSHMFYFSDNWKVTQKLSLNLGLRYEHKRPWEDKRGFLSNLDPACAQRLDPSVSPVPQCFNPPVTIANPVYPATGRFAERVPIADWDPTGWNPRVGLAYRATNDTVVRAGYGVYANMITAGMLYGNILNNPRANATTMTFQTSPDDPSISLSNPFVVSTLVPGSGLPNVAANQVPLPQTYMNNWGLSIQQELTPMMMFEAGYQGTHTVHLIQYRQFNDAIPGPGPRQSRRPFPTLQSYLYLDGSGDQSYNAMELKFQKRAGREGVSAIAVYTWAKSMDTSSAGDFGMGGRGISRNLTNEQNRAAGDANLRGGSPPPRCGTSRSGPGVHS